jgi:hypothetical protein
MAGEWVDRLPRVRDPRNSYKHGVTIPAPTPTVIRIPNPWKLSSDGARSGQPRTER